jgi:DNA-binding winged helix-turn-helix (wHTH) protein/tetratricopeptide (TPR) repeat protein
MSDASILRFGTFELHPKSRELRRLGDPVKLPPQPFKVLEVLVRKGGEIVTREEIRERVWPGDTFVDFDQGLNFCIRQIREALGDNAESPQYIETLPRRGYRFVAMVESAEIGRVGAPTRLIVLPFRMLRPDAETDFLAFSLPDALTSSLCGLESLVVRSSLAASRFGGKELDPRKIGEEADVDVILAGTLLRTVDRIRVSSQLTDASAGTLLWSHTTEVPVGNLFQVYDELVHRIVDSLSLPLTARERRMLRNDVPSSTRAYEDFLRANQLSLDAKQWSVARDLYERCVQDDPRYAPAWARLGRVRHVMAKYLQTGKQEELDRAEAAFRRALELNGDLAIAHKLYAQLEVDLGRAHDAMVRLVGRARSADPELCAGLVSTCRYCGLLDASLAADALAHHLEPRIRTSVPHTWFLQGDYRRVASQRLPENPYIIAISLGALGRQDEAIAALHELEKTTTTRMRDFMVAARTLLEGNTAQSVSVIERIVASDFRDPEGLFYLARHLSHLQEVTPALALFERVVEGGFYCFPAMTHDPWLDPLRKKPSFVRQLRQAESQHRKAAAAFAELQGDKVLAVARAS